MHPWRLFLLLTLTGFSLSASDVTWTSPATGQALACTVLEPTTPVTAGAILPVVFYLENLAAPRIGTDSDEAIIRDLRATGHLVVVLDYAHHPQARTPTLEKDLVALRRELQQKRLLAERPVDPARIFIVPSGHRLLRDIVYYREAGRTLAMDLLYPSHPAQPVGAVLEFSCDNANRMGNFSLDFCTDTILPIAASEGLTVAMADHPVAAPYQGLDPMPDSARKAKAAVRTLRAVGASLGCNGRIVPVGFSRGSGMALLLTTTQDHPELDGLGEHPGTDSQVQGAVVMSGRFTYLDLLPDDKMIPRYEKAWGTRTDHMDIWRAHGALDYLTHPTVPLFLTINATESPDALHQMDVLKRRLQELSSPFECQPELEPRGHRMPLDPAVLVPLHRYLQGQLHATDHLETIHPARP
jgi:acetyl esterase/lipase